VTLLPGLLLAQGPLTPPGAPAPTMKTLDQLDAKLEKRTPISALPFTISAAGSYYLTGNLNVATGTAITITADDVTLDLNGFTIASTASPATGLGVSINGVRKNVTVKNGHIRGTTTFAAGTFTSGGFLHGIVSASVASANLRVTDVKVSGMGGDGIDFLQATPPLSVVERCNVTVCGLMGIRAGQVLDCTVENAGDIGIRANTVINCYAKSVGTDAADDAIEADITVANCQGDASSGNGIASGRNASNSEGRSDGGGTGLQAINAANCTGSSDSGIGINAGNATNCAGSSSGGIGLEANNATNSSGTTSFGTFGMNIAGTASFCRGSHTAGGVAISAGIAIGCTKALGTVSSANKFLGTP
jgi:hypothetical protein